MQATFKIKQVNPPKSKCSFHFQAIRQILPFQGSDWHLANSVNAVFTEPHCVASASVLWIQMLLKPKGEEGIWLALLLLISIYFNNTLNFNLLLKPCPSRRTHPLSLTFFSGFCSFKTLSSFRCSFSIIYHKTCFLPAEMRLVSLSFHCTRSVKFSGKTPRHWSSSLRWIQSDSFTPISHPSSWRRRQRWDTEGQMWAGIFLTEYRPRRYQGITKAMLIFGLETIQEEDGWGRREKCFCTLLNRVKATSHQNRYENSYLTQSV